MNWQAFAVIGTLAVATAALLYLPFSIWFRWRSSKPQRGKDSLHVTTAGVCFYGTMVMALLAGLAIGTLSPESWFGAQVRTPFGGFGFFSAVNLIASVLERMLVKRGFVFLKRTIAIAIEDSSEPDKTDNASEPS